MRVRINNIRLEGTARSVPFRPGLNIITGPIASGKTTLLRLSRFLLGGSLENLPPEARQSVTAVLGEVILGQNQYSIIRPVVTTRTARVDIAGAGEALRLPMTQTDRTPEVTYTHWLLDHLSLPRLQVPSAPTKPESEPTPVSLNDYLLYCTIMQDEIGFQIFGHHDPFKDIKRKYVFQIIYGLYSIETAQIQEELREVQARLRELRSQDELFSRFLSNTALENRAEIEANLQTAQLELQSIEADVSETSAKSRMLPQTEILRKRVLDIEAEIQRLRAELDAERRAIRDLESLAAQIETQTGRITRSIVAGKHLSNIEFVVCPRCGAEINQGRSDDDQCYLCLQHPVSSRYNRKALIDEQARIESQLSETRDLVAARQKHSEHLKAEEELKMGEQEKIRSELDFQTQTFISTEASKIATLAARRAEIRTRISQLMDYLQIFKKLDDVRQWASKLAERKAELESKLEDTSGQEAEVQYRINYLIDQFNEILEQFRPPEFGEEKRSGIDRRTFLPTYHGRRFDDLSSPGLGTLVNVAYALAHHKTNLDLSLRLPSILFIDGLSEHLGEEGLDPERLLAIYKYLIESSEKLGDQLQIIVIDNEVPQVARNFVTLELSDTDRLIPTTIT